MTPSTLPGAFVVWGLGGFVSLYRWCYADCMPPRRVVPATALLCALAWSAVAQSDPWLVRYYANYAADLQESWREFELVTSARDHDERLNATLPVTYDTEPAGAVLTLLDHRTGQPLQTCEAPCALFVDPARRYAVMAFRWGFEPGWSHYAPDMEPGERRIDLGRDFAALRARKGACYKAWQASDKLDAEATPCFRYPPRMPRSAERSGHCMVRFDVDTRGQPVNVDAFRCSDPLFKTPSETAISWWHYTPRTERGQALVQERIVSRMSFRLNDANGDPIPE